MAPHKGRGAVTNRAGRFERFATQADDDGWWHDEADAPAPATTVTMDASRTVITRNQSPDLPFDRSINAYRGCEHGCVYCYARPTHAWLGLSPGLDLETKLFAKPDAAAILKAELCHPRYRCRAIAMGTNTDPYQPLERRMGITRAILEVLAATNHPVTILTKSASVCADIDIIAPMAAKGLAAVAVSVTTLDGDLARAMEPRATAPARRLKTIQALASAGIPTAVMVAPIIPGLTDHEIEPTLEAAAAHNAAGASYVLLRLPLEVKELFEEWLRAHRPDRAERVLNLVRETRSGALYNAQFGERMVGSGPIAQLIARRFGMAERKWQLDAKQFRPPMRAGQQLQLL